MQDEFAAALLDPDAAPPSEIRAPEGASPAHRFAIYRNNVTRGLIDALAGRFPVVARLVGREFFDAMAGVYVRAEPPRSPLMLRYGDTFPAFVERFGPAAPVPYLADVARLEWARGAAYHALNIAPLDMDAFARFQPSLLVSCGVRLHPSMSLVASTFPIVSLWRAHLDGAAVRPPEWVGEDALIARPDLEVDVYVLPRGGLGFFTALAAGASVGAAAAWAAAESPDFDVVETITLLLKARVAVELIPRRC